MQSLGRANALEFARLNHAQQFRLLVHRDVRDLVHEKSAFIGQLETSGPVRLRIGERPFDVTEEFAFE